MVHIGDDWNRISLRVIDKLSPIAGRPQIVKQVAPCGGVARGVAASVTLSCLRWSSLCNHLVRPVFLELGMKNKSLNAHFLG